jgi:hypothetical protein
MIERPLSGPKGGIYWYVLQTYSAADIAFDRYVRMFDGIEHLITYKNESERRIQIAGHFDLFFKSGQNFEDLRAETLNGVVIDEMRQQNAALWARVIRPMLSRYKGWADLYSSPNGYDHFYDLFQEAQANPEEWGAFHAPSTEAFWWTPDEIASAKRTMSEAEFAQEILAEFRSIMQGKAYLCAGQHNARIGSPFTQTGAIHPSLPIIVAMDFNLSPMAWTLGQRKGDCFHWHDEIWLQNSHTPEAALELVERVMGHKPGVILIGDATGKAGQRAAAGQSDYDIICDTLNKAGIRWENVTPDSNPMVKDRINNMNAKLKAADGTVRLTFDKVNCPKLGKDLDRVCWKAGAQVTLDQTSDPTLTHASDGVGYAVCALSPMELSVGGVGRLRVISR